MDSQYFSLGYIRRKLTESGWLAAVQTTLWQRFLELMKSSKHDSEVASMLKPFWVKVTVASFVPELDHDQLGYERKMHFDLVVLCVCVFAGGDEAVANPARDALCQAAASAFHFTTCQFSVATSQSPTYKSLWSKVNKYSKQALDSKELLAHFERARTCLQSILSPTLEIVEKTKILKEWTKSYPAGLQCLLLALTCHQLTAEKEQLESLSEQVTSYVGEVSYQPLVDFLSEQWTTEILSPDSDFDFAETYKIQLPAVMGGLESFELEGPT